MTHPLQDVVEDWVVGSNKFWRKGDVNTGPYIVDFRGTWAQVLERSEAMAEMERRHGREQKELAERHRAERKIYWP